MKTKSLIQLRELTASVLKSQTNLSIFFSNITDANFETMIRLSGEEFGYNN